MKIAITVSKTTIIGLLSAITLVLPSVSHAAESDYGAGFWASPSNLSPDNERIAPSKVDKGNYGAGFKTPELSGSIPTVNGSVPGNYGAPAFMPSPTGISGVSSNPAIHVSNFGAGFAESPTTFNSFTFRPNSANYGAGFRTYGAPFAWSFAPYRMYSFGWWL